MNEKFFVKIGKSITLPAQNFVVGEMFFGKLPYILSHLCTLCRNFSEIRHKCFSSLLEFALYMSESKNWKKNFREKNSFNIYSDFQHIFSRLSTFSFRNALYKVPFLSRAKWWIWKLFEHYRVRDFFRVLSEGFCTSDENVESVFWKLHSTYADGNNGGSCLSRNQSFYFFNFYLVFERKSFVTWVKNFSSLLTNTFNPGLSLFSIFSSSFCYFWRY